MSKAGIRYVLLISKMQWKNNRRSNITLKNILLKLSFTFLENFYYICTCMHLHKIAKTVALVYGIQWKKIYTILPIL